MPDDFTLEDLQYHLFVLQKLEKAEKQLNQGCKIYALDEMRVSVLQIQNVIKLLEIS